MDDAGFKELFDATYPALARYARHRGLAREDAEDLIAATYEVAWRRVDVVPEGGEALLWLYTVAFNQLRNLRRRTQRDQDLTVRLPAPEVAFPADESDDRSIAAIRRALDSLSAKDRELILLIATEGLTAAQAGVVVGCGVVATRTRLHRARKRLAVILESEREVQRPKRIRHEREADDKPTEALT
jgi:RNA polymerase sigma-70 factor (ECF subfamily)